MYSIRIFLAIYIFGLCPSLALAEVNINYGELKLQHQDSISNTVQLIRNYSSRSLRKGLYGYGWCSPLDLKIKASSKETFKITTCDEILKINLNNLSHNPKAQIFTYIYQHNQYHFNKEARLISVKIANTEYFYNYKPGTQLLTSIHSKDKKILITIENQLIKSISTNINTLSYNYTNHKLTEILTNSKVNFIYQYDEFANLTFWKQGTYFEKIKYNDEFDLVQTYQQKDKCQNTYEYSRFNKSKFILHYRNCPNSSDQIIKYTFDYQKKQIKININQKPTKIGDLNEKSKNINSPL